MTETFFDAYVRCALWSSTDESTPAGGYPLDDNYGPDDILPESLAAMRTDCDRFEDENADDLADIEPAQAGHDLWLTRNGHGAGYWDRGLGELGDRLTDAAHAYGEVSLLVTDDGRLDYVRG